MKQKYVQLLRALTGNKKSELAQVTVVSGRKNTRGYGGKVVEGIGRELSWS